MKDSTATGPNVRCSEGLDPSGAPFLDVLDHLKIEGPWFAVDVE